MSDQQAQARDRAALSRGASSDAIHAMVRRALVDRHRDGGLLVDVGCGTGGLWNAVSDLFDDYVGVDAVRYAGFPEALEYRSADLNDDPLPVTDAAAAVVAAVEIIEHLENPRRLLRELTRVARPGGVILVTTPNQLSLLSLVTLVLKGRFNAFQDAHYPAHLTALLEVDLRRMAGEVGWADVAVRYSQSGRVAFTPLHYPSMVVRLFPRRCSDNLLIIGRKSA